MTSTIFRHSLAFGALILLIAPVYGQISVRSGLSDDRTVEPGTTYEGTIVVKNETDKIQQAKIYQTDYLFSADGSNIYGTPGRDERSNADWTLISNPLLTIPPNETVNLAYVVTVPSSTPEFTLEGSYCSMIMVEALPRESPESTLEKDDENPQYGILQIMRYGVQVATHIQGTGKSNLQMEGTGLIQLDDGATALNLQINNGGDVMERPEIWIELYLEDGTLKGRHDGVQNRIYPGTGVSQQISLGTIEPGNYRALVILDAGGENVFGAEYTLEINGS